MQKVPYTSDDSIFADCIHTTSIVSPVILVAGYPRHDATDAARPDRVGSGGQDDRPSEHGGEDESTTAVDDQRRPRALPGRVYTRGTAQ